MSKYTIFYSNENKQPENSIEIERGGANNELSITLSGRASIEYNLDLQTAILHILENFNGDVPPIRPTEGQTWYDQNTGLLKVSTVNVPYDGSANPPTLEELIWLTVEFIHSGPVEPTGTTKLWYDTSNDILKMFNGTNYESVLTNYVRLIGDTVNGGVVATQSADIISNGTTSGSVLDVSTTTTNNDFLFTTKVESTNPDDYIEFSNVDAMLNYDNVGVNANLLGSTIFEVGSVNLVSSATSNAISSELKLQPTAHVTGVADATASTDAITRRQHNLALASVNDYTLLLSDGSNSMLGDLNVYNLKFEAPSPKLKLSVANQIKQYELVGVGGSGSGLRIKQTSSNATLNLDVFDIQDTTSRFIIPARTTNFSTPTLDDEAANLAYVHTQGNIANSTVNYVRQKIPHAWAVCRIENGTLVVKNSYNIQGVQYNSQGKWSVYYQNDTPHLKCAFVSSIVNVSSITTGWTYQGKTTGDPLNIRTIQMTTTPTVGTIFSTNTTAGYTVEQPNHVDGGRLMRFYRTRKVPPNGTQFHFVVYTL